MCTQTPHIHKLCPCHKVIITTCPFQEAAEGHARHKRKEEPDYTLCRNFTVEREERVEGCCGMGEGGTCPYAAKNKRDQQRLQAAEVGVGVGKEAKRIWWDADDFYLTKWMD